MRLAGTLFVFAQASIPSPFRHGGVYLYMNPTHGCFTYQSDFADDSWLMRSILVSSTATVSNPISIVWDAK